MTTSKIDKIDKNTLTYFFGVPTICFRINTGRLALQEFARKYPLETEYVREDNIVVFDTDSEHFQIRADMNPDGSTVFNGSVIGFMPYGTLFESEYYSSIDEVLLRLKTFAERSAVLAAKRLKNNVKPKVKPVTPESVKAARRAHFDLKQTPKPLFESTMSKFIDSLKDAVKHDTDISYLAKVGVFFEKNESKIGRQLPTAVEQAFKRALKFNTDIAYLAKAVELAAKELL